MNRNTEITVSWRSVAVAALVLAIGSGTSLAVVASIRNADGLAVVALALAIIAFGSELLIAGVQVLLAARQQEDAHRLGSESLAALAEVRTLAGDLALGLRTQFDRVLEHALLQARQEVTPEEAEVVEEFAERLRSDVASSPLVDSMRRSVALGLETLFVNWLRDHQVKRLPAPLGSRADFIWIANDRNYAGLVKAPQSPTYLHGAALRRYVAQTRRAADEMGIGTIGVLILPNAPAGDDWQMEAVNAGIIVVWPDTFDRVLTEPPTN
jgi:hypothetical protein